MDLITQNQTHAEASLFKASGPSPSSRPSSSYSTETAFSNTSTTSFSSAHSTNSTVSTTKAPKWNIHKPQYDAKGQKLDAMSRKYIVSEQQLSMEELLALPPLPRTFRYGLQEEDDANLKKRKESEEEAAEKRKGELENAKRMLRDLALGIK